LTLDRLAVDLLFDQSPKHGGALAMAHQHKASAFVVVGEIGFPCSEDVSIGEFPAQRHRLSRHQRDQSWDRDLAVNRREKSTTSAETRKLLNDSATQVAINREIGVARRFHRHGGICIEAVDRGVWIGAEHLARRRAVLRDDRRIEVDRADIGAPGAANPKRRIGIVRGRRFRLSLRVRRLSASIVSSAQGG
jgi:hypothetical protein